MKQVIAHSASRTAATLRTRTLAVMTAALLALFVTCACGCSAPAGNADNKNVTPATSSQQNENVNTNLDAEDGYLITMTIDAGDPDKVKEYAVEMPVSDEAPTVLAVLEAAAAENGFDINVADSEYGAYVDSIDGIANGSAGASSGWTYTVNGESVMESAGTCTVKAGDTVEWVFFS